MSERSAGLLPLPRGLTLSGLVAVPGSYLGAASYLGLPAPDLPSAVAAAVYGLAVVGAAFILSWAAEAAQVDINAGMALALLALLAILPEYAVDFVFTYQCGQAYGGGGGPPPEVCSLALANMTGANRVLVGIGWPLVVMVAALAVWRTSRSEGVPMREAESRSTRSDAVRLPRTMSVEVSFLLLATVYSLTLPLKSTLTLWDSLVLGAIFLGYVWRLAKAEVSEPDLLGVSAWVGHKPARSRRTWVVTMFVLAALVILLSAEHFAHGLVATGDDLGISKFLLVQWIAPLASESPELIVACLYAWRLKASDSLGTLLSSKVNQWTLLVGTLPVVFAIFATTTAGLPLDTEQRFELLITAAQSLFAVALLVDLGITFKGASALLTLFLVQFVVSVVGTAQANRAVIVAMSVAYGVLALVRLTRRRSALAAVLRDGMLRPVAELSDRPTEDAPVRD